jgi:hypothetical protein
MANFLKNRNDEPMKQPYTEETEQLMKALFGTLSEKDRRRYAAVEVQKLGWGGIVYIGRLLGITDKTITQGLSDLKEAQEPAKNRIRKAGGGGKPMIGATPGLEKVFF